MVSNKGHLILAANILGPLDSLSERTKIALKEADLAIFEEDRPARQTLKLAGIHREYIKFNEHKQTQSLELLREYLEGGKTVIYMSDQGMPTLADPGRELLSAAYALKAKVTIHPGPSSITAALSACPFLTGGFYYFGFLDRDKEVRQTQITQIFNHREPVVILETPYRFSSLCAAFEESGEYKDRRVLLAIDISGPDESYRILKVKEMKSLEEMIHKKLNFVVVIEPTKTIQKVPSKNSKKQPPPFRKGFNHRKKKTKR